jgi:hypothetical protein
MKDPEGRAKGHGDGGSCARAPDALLLRALKQLAMLLDALNVSLRLLLDDDFICGRARPVAG